MCKRLFYGLCLITLFIACQEENDDFYEEMVVEGWIESGSAPVVILSRNFTMASYDETEDCELSHLNENFVLPWGKVTVSDGIKSVILTGSLDGRYFPPYAYTTSKMKGVPGRTYTLRVEYGERLVTAQTTIPVTDSLEALTVTPCEDVDSLYQITAFYEDDPSTKDYYLFLTRIFNKESRFYPSLFGVIDDERLTAYNQQIVQPGVHRLTNLMHAKYRPYFHERDSVQIKFAKIDETTYNIHKAYNEMLSLSANPVFASDISLPTNIQGGLGYWCGYAVSSYNVVIADSLR